MDEHTDLLDPTPCEFCEAYNKLSKHFKSKVMQFMIQCKQLEDMKKANKKFSKLT